MELAIVIVNWNGRDLLARCLRSIGAHAADIDHLVYVVDNGSTDGSREMLRAEFPHVLLDDNARNLGFGGGNNLALRRLLALGESVPPQSPEYVLLLNPDTEVEPGALQALLGFMRARPHVGVAGAWLLNPDRSFQASHAPFPTLAQELLILSGLGRARHGGWYPSTGPDESRAARDDVDYVVGACLIARPAAVREVGLFDEGFFMYSEEVDWCYRFRAAGWAVGYEPAARIVHVGGGSTRQVRPQMLAELYRSRVRFFRKHYGPLAALGLRALLLAMNSTKTARAALRRSPGGTPPLPWPLLLRALALGESFKGTHA